MKPVSGSNLYWQAHTKPTKAAPDWVIYMAYSYI